MKKRDRSLMRLLMYKTVFRIEHETKWHTIKPWSVPLAINASQCVA